MGPRASSAWRGVRRLCGMYKYTTNPSCGWDVNKTEVPCWEIKEPSVTAHYEHYAHDEWSIRDLLHWQNYPSLPITFPCFESHGVWIFKCSRPEYSWKIARWTLSTNQSINQSLVLWPLYYWICSQKGTFNRYADLQLFTVHILLLIIHISHDDGSWGAYSNTGMRQFGSETGNTPPFLMHN